MALLRGRNGNRRQLLQKTGCVLEFEETTKGTSAWLELLAVTRGIVAGSLDLDPRMTLKRVRHGCCCGAEPLLEARQRSSLSSAPPAMGSAAEAWRLANLGPWVERRSVAAN